MRSLAIEWLISQLGTRYMLSIDDDDYSAYLKILNKAKEMEHEQITEAYLQGLYSDIKMKGEKQAEQYFDKTYTK